MRRRKVLLVLPLVLGWRTYAGRILEIIAEREDIDATVCTYTEEDGQLWLRLLRRRVPTLSGSKFLLHPIFNGLAWGRRQLNRARRQGGYDAVHIATAMLASAFVEHLPRSMPLSVALDVTFRRPVRVMGSILRAREVDELEASVYQRASMLFPFSRWASDSLIQDYGVSPDKVCVVPPSVVIEGTRPAAPSERDKLMVDVAFVGNPFAAKGGPDLLRVHQRYFRDRATLHIVSRTFRPSGRLKNVVHYPFLDNDVLIKDFLPSMNVFCLPTHADMSSFAVAEASAAGLPSITTETGGVGDLCINGETGFLIRVRDIHSLADRLDRLVSDPALRQRQGLAARQFAQQKLNARCNYNHLIDLTMQPA